MTLSQLIVNPANMHQTATDRPTRAVCFSASRSRREKVMTGGLWDAENEDWLREITRSVFRKS
jgi:hypothetical protein